MKHLTDSDIKNFYSHSLRQEEEMSLLAHMAKCEYCAGRLSSNFPENELLTPPPDLQNDILYAAGKIPSKKERKMEFYRYSTKVVLSVAMSLSLLVLGNFSGIIFNSVPIKIETLTDKNISETNLNTEKKTYQETIQKQKEENNKMYKKFVQEKKEQNNRKMENGEKSDNHHIDFKKFPSGFLSYFTDK